MPASRMRSPLGRAIGLGSAKEGVEHWWLQRLTALALIPLALWFLVVAIGLVGADIGTVRQAIGRPVPATAVILLLIAVFYHVALGLQVVIEDYVHAELAKFALLALNRLICFALAVAGIVAVLKMALAG